MTPLLRFLIALCLIALCIGFAWAAGTWPWHQTLLLFLAAMAGLAAVGVTEAMR